MTPGSRIIALSAATSLLVSSIVLVTGIQFLPQSRDTLAAPNESLTELERAVQEESPIIQAVERTEPAVVSVIISKDLPVLERVYETVPFGDSGLRIPSIRQRGTEVRQVGGGTAFFVTEDGLMLTNKHVVSDPAAVYTVLLNDGKRLNATVVARDFLTDIALLKVEGSGFPALSLSSSDEPTLGQSVIAIGNALAEFRNTVSVGVVSGLQRTITAGNPAQGTVERLSRIIQTDAAINEGNSGGPLLNLQGEVIGMNTAVATQGQNIGFAIPVMDMRRVVESYRQYGRIVRPYLGVRYSALTPEIAEELDLPFEQGMLIGSGNTTAEPAIVKGSPAEKAGLRSGDIILEADGQKLVEEYDLGDTIQRKQPGDELTLLIARDSKEQTITVRLEEWKE